MHRQIITAILIGILCFLIAPIQGQVQALDRKDFTQINENGFGDPNNSYAWAMTWFKGKLYVGTFRNMLEMRALAEPLPPLDPYPVPVPEEISDLDLRAEIWQYTPETAKWKRVYQSPTITAQSADGSTVEIARDVGYRCMAVFTEESGKEALYVSSAGRAESYILYTEDGENFAVLSIDPGMDFPGEEKITSIRSLIVFNGRLYMTPASAGLPTAEFTSAIQPRQWGEGSQIVFESVDLDLVNNIFHFRPVSPLGFNDENNAVIWELAAFNGYLYAGTGNGEEGYQIWKTNALGWPYRWTCVIKDGAYRGPQNGGPASMFPFEGKLYIGSGIFGGGAHPITGLWGLPELIRINPDDSWELICGMPRMTPDGFKKPLSGKGLGFGNIFAAYLWRMEEHDGWLYLSVMDNSAFLPYLPLEDLPEWIDVNRIVRRQGGFDLWKTEDGVKWYRVTIGGLGNPLNIGARTLQSTPFGLFVGTANPFTVGDAEGHPGGTEVWLGTP